MNNKIKHLELVQNVITRMANNSFMLKGWGVTLTAAIFALAGKSDNALYILIIFVSLLAFWGLDSYYLLQERLYRALYDKVRETSEENIDFSLKVAQNEFENKRIAYRNCFLSGTEAGFYLPIILGCIVLFVIILTCN